MISVSAIYLNALSTSHDVDVHISLLRANVTVLARIPFLDGSITADGNAWVRRTLTLTLPPTIETSSYTNTPVCDLIRAETDELRIVRSVVLPDGSRETIPLGVFRIDAVPDSFNDTTPVSLTGYDRAADIADDTFLQTRPFRADSTTSLITQLIQETSPNFVVRNETLKARDERVPTTHVDGSRADFIQKLAEGIGAVVCVDPEGEFVIADAPTLKDTPITRIRGGADGTLTNVTSTTGREGVFNAVVVRGASPSGDFAPVQATVYDSHPLSPTRWGDRLSGAFGKVPKTFDRPAITTFLQAQAAAAGLLGKYAGMLTPLNLSSVPMPHLEPGDCVFVIPRDLPAGAGARVMIVDSWTLDLRAGGDFTMLTRDVREMTLDA